MLFPTVKVPPPHVFRFHQRMAPEAADAAALAAASDIFKQRGTEVAALVIEPLMQGAAGMWAHSAAYLRAMAAMARAAGALLIVDEVATGFGRTGRMFACEHAGISPDLLCLGKGITGGYLPLAATLTSERIFARLPGTTGGISGLLLRSHLHRKSTRRSHRRRQSGNFSPGAGDRADPAAYRTVTDRTGSHFGIHPRVADIRQWGLMAGVELMESPAERRAFPYAAQVGARIARAARKGRRRGSSVG